MLCSLLTMLCIVGGVEVGPDLYKMDILDVIDGTVHEVVVPMQLKDRLF